MKGMRACVLPIMFLLCVPSLSIAAQQKPRKSNKEETKTTAAAEAKKPADKMSAAAFAGLELRPIGPALISGRVVAVAVDPNDRAHYYVGAASGGVWVTKNDGGTWTPVFDHEGSYSIGAIAIDPTNPAVVWVGTGEANSQRSVAYGDGVYRSKRWRRELDEHGPEGFAAHRQNRHRPKGFKYSVRRGAGAAVE